MLFIVSIREHSLKINIFRTKLRKVNINNIHKKDLKSKLKKELSF